jgi:uncharacterized protein YdiU (UPF0061 family)
MSAPISFSNSYCKLPDTFYTRQPLQPVASPALVHANIELAASLGIDPDWFRSESAVAVFAGNESLSGSDPIATVYAGFQFGNFNPRLGDGRALLLGEILSEDARFDLQLKGSGPTSYSRGGDGRSPLGPVLREYLVSEAMAALGVPTTRSLFAISTGELVQRERPEPGGILTRVAQSHIRFGTFQYFSAQQDHAGLRELADYTIARHFPALVTTTNPYLKLLEAVIDKVACLVSHWQSLGFIHGVMNTDNMLVTGETVDYGPCAFMDTFSQAAVYSAIDQGARYAFQNQPSIAHWNLMTFAQALLPLLDDDEHLAIAAAKTALEAFPEIFDGYWRRHSAAKLGLPATDASTSLYLDMLRLLERDKMDFTLSFNALIQNLSEDQAIFEHPDWQHWTERWRSLIDDITAAETLMMTSNPYVIPRNHQIEFAIAEAYQHDRFEHFSEMLAAVTDPYNPERADSIFAQAPGPDQIVRRTFCGT